MATQTQPSPCLIVIFGASGDLTERKLIPSLYDLHLTGQLPKEVAVLGISRTKMSDDDFRNHLEPSIEKFAHKFDQASWRDFAKRVHYLPADSTKIDAYGDIKGRVCELAEEHNTGQNTLFYLSVAPHLYEPIVDCLNESQMVSPTRTYCATDDGSEPGWQRVVVEKPFGVDPESAVHLNRVLARAFDEESIYRIDHYLGKETVQNMLVFRFANAIFEPIWNRNYIDHVQVTAAETVGVEGRGGYYDSPSGGAMRDMIQSHLLQLMAVVAMEPPVSIKAGDVRSEKMKVLSACRRIKPEDVSKLAVRGQYSAGYVNKEPVPGYREEDGVNPASTTETYAALQVMIDTWRWQGVPFCLRSGKRMPKKTTEIVINFKSTPHTLFREGVGKDLTPNQIVINVQPDEGIRLRFEGKVPGTRMKIKSVVMDFDYIEQFRAEPPEAYATLLLDVMRSDQTLFKHRDEIETAWELVQPVLDYWKDSTEEVIPQYTSGSWGPNESDVMLARDERAWHNPM